MKIWVDADACPREVKEVLFRTADRLKIPTVLVANGDLRLPPSPYLSTVRVSAGLDVADGYLVKHAQAGDLAVTADIPLASALVEKRVAVIDPRGEEYTADSIGERLAVRDFMDGLRGAGVETGGARPYGARDKQAFAAALDRVLTKAMRVR